jgi:hypothetical protein
MQPILWEGERYTSQYFHAQYRQGLQERGEQGKYVEHRHFLQAIRHIPAFDKFFEHGNIIVLTWQEVKSTNLPGKSVNDINYFQRLFASTGYQPITLLDASAQLELTHHLDDELSKEIAYRHSHTTATQQLSSRQRVPMLPTTIAAQAMEDMFRMGRMMHVPEHIVQQETVKYIAQETGVDLRPLLLAAPAQNEIAAADKMLEPTDLAKALGLRSGHHLNRALEQIGWQVKRIGGGWDATPTGQPHASEHAWTADHGNKHGYNWRWRLEDVRDALTTHGLLA